jgi:hypothetical protein
MMRSSAPTAVAVRRTPIRASCSARPSPKAKRSSEADTLAGKSGLPDVKRSQIETLLAAAERRRQSVGQTLQIIRICLDDNDAYRAEADPLATWIKTCDLHQGYHYDGASHVTIGERAGAALLPLARKTVPQEAGEIAAGRKRFLARQPEPGNPDTRPLAKRLIAYWKFDEGKGNSTADSSSSNNTGIIKGNPKWIDGLFGKALYLTGKQRIEMPTFQEPLGPSGNIENLSVSFWLRGNRYGDGRVGRGTGEKYEKRNDHNWQYSEHANHIIPAPKGVPLTIGGLIERAGQFQVFDELAIWSRPLTLEDARTLYNNGHGVEIKPAGS